VVVAGGPESKIKVIALRSASSGRLRNLTQSLACLSAGNGGNHPRRTTVRHQLDVLDAVLQHAVLSSHNTASHWLACSS
jgi:hypothetical protein